MSKTKMNKNLFLVNKTSYHNDNNHYDPLTTSSCFHNYINNPIKTVNLMSSLSNYDKTMVTTMTSHSKQNSLSTMNQSKMPLHTNRNFSKDIKSCQKIVDSQFDSLISKQLLKHKTVTKDFTERQVMFHRQTKELITMMNEPRKRIKQKNEEDSNNYQCLNTVSNTCSIDSKKRNALSMSKYICDINLHENYFDNKGDNGNIKKSSSLQRIDHMKRKLNKEIASFSPSKYIEPKVDKGIDIFKGSRMRSLKNKIYDLKNFQFFINYNARKIDTEKLAKSTLNTMTILASVKKTVEQNIENVDEDINIDELV